MIRDVVFKVICLPLLGVGIPLGAHLFCCPQPSTGQIIYTLLFFSGFSLLMWQASIWLVSSTRRGRWLQGAFAQRLLLICLLAGAGSFLFSVLAAYLWQQWMLPHTAATAVRSTGIMYGIAAVGLVLVYENLFQAKERELDGHIVGQLDQERMQAELNSLKAELGPHFIFNALTTLTQLIGTAPDTAEAFTQKLARVYQYFLINKNRELISLEEELRFIEDYFFLVQIRYDKGLHLQLSVGEKSDAKMIIPCSLQLLVENAIKHNSFSDKDPLLIVIKISGSSVTVENELRRKPYIVPGTGIGLVHLRQHYRLACNREIVITEKDRRFAVTVPLIK